MHTSFRPVASGGARGACAPPVFGRTANPISTRGADYAHHSTKCPPRFSDLATALTCIRNLKLQMPSVLEKRALTGACSAQNPQVP